MSTVRDRHFLTMGELMLRLAPPGHELLLQSGQLQCHWGGSECNVAAALAGFGNQVSFLTALPNNALGDRALQELRRIGVVTSPAGQIERHEGRLGLYFYTPGALHRASEVLYDRADSVFAQHAIANASIDQALAKASHFHLSGITPALSPRCLQQSRYALQRATALGMVNSFDCNYRQALWQRWQGDARGALCALIADVDVLFGDDRDIALLLGTEVVAGSVEQRLAAAATQAFAHFPRLKLMLCTLRETLQTQHHRLGAWLMQRDQTAMQLDALDLPNVVDRVGTGDAFVAGFLHEFSRSANTRESLRFALAAACLKHSVPGDQLGLGESYVRDLCAERSLQIRR